MSNYRAPQAQQAPEARKSRASEQAPTPHAEGATGVPLPQAMRRQMEEAFGASFNGVRLDVNRSAEARGARAFAQGSRITVAPGEWSTGGRSVSRLIAHELAHVQQQRAGRVPGKGGAVNADAALEAEADAAAERVVNGSAANVRGGDATLDTATAPVQLVEKTPRRASATPEAEPTTNDSPYGAAGTYGSVTPEAAPQTNDSPYGAAGTYGSVTPEAAPQTNDSPYGAAGIYGSSVSETPEAVPEPSSSTDQPKTNNATPKPKLHPAHEWGLKNPPPPRAAAPAPLNAPPQTRLQKIAAMRAQRPGNAANEEWPRDIKPLRRGSKYEGEFERVGFRAFLPAQDDAEKGIHGLSDEKHNRTNPFLQDASMTNSTVTRKFTPEERDQRTLTPTTLTGEDREQRDAAKHGNSISVRNGLTKGLLSPRSQGLNTQGKTVLQAKRNKLTYAMSKTGQVAANNFDDKQRVVPLEGDPNGNSQKQNPHHSSLFAGEDVSHAGHLSTDGDGQVTYLDDNSGHHRPTEAHTAFAFNRLATEGVLDPNRTSGRVGMVDKGITSKVGEGTEGMVDVNFTGYGQAKGNEAAIRAREQQRLKIEEVGRPKRQTEDARANHKKLLAPIKDGNPGASLRPTKDKMSVKQMSVADNFQFAQDEKNRKHLKAQRAARRTADS